MRFTLPKTDVMACGWEPSTVLVLAISRVQLILYPLIKIMDPFLQPVPPILWSDVLQAVWNYLHMSRKQYICWVNLSTLRLLTSRSNGNERHDVAREGWGGGCTHRRRGCPLVLYVYQVLGKTVTTMVCSCEYKIRREDSEFVRYKVDDTVRTQHVHKLVLEGRWEPRLLTLKRFIVATSGGRMRRGAHEPLVRDCKTNSL